MWDVTSSMHDSVSSGFAAQIAPARLTLLFAAVCCQAAIAVCTDAPLRALTSVGWQRPTGKHASLGVMILVCSGFVSCKLNKLCMLTAQASSAPVPPGTATKLALSDGDACAEVPPNCTMVVCLGRHNSQVMQSMFDRTEHNLSSLEP